MAKLTPAEKKAQQQQKAERIARRKAARGGLSRKAAQAVGVLVPQATPERTAFERIAARIAARKGLTRRRPG